MRARFLDPAADEVRDAIAYLDEQREGLGQRFERMLEDTVAFVNAHPSSGKPLTRRVRKFPLRTFPYHIIYVIDAEEVVIVAVAHHRRRAGYWRNRLGDTAGRTT